MRTTRLSAVSVNVKTLDFIGGAERGRTDDLLNAMEEIETQRELLDLNFHGTFHLRKGVREETLFSALDVRNGRTGGRRIQAQSSYARVIFSRSRASPIFAPGDRDDLVRRRMWR
jgi:hypothetical protein